MAQHGHDCIVIGAGIVGLSIAFRLIEAGKSVLIIDRKGMAEETSRGNAGALAFADIEPMASPGIIWQAPKWLFDPLGPLSLPPAYAPKIAPWLLRFFRASLPGNHAAGTKAQTALMELSKAETEPLFEAAGISELIRHDGALTLYEGQRQFNAAASLWHARETHGIAFEHVTGKRLAELQPGLAPSITHATFVPGWKTVSDPYAVTVSIGKAALERGAYMQIAEVTGIEQGADGVTLKLDDGNTLSARHAIIAAGAWSHMLARQLGDTIPLETERGYNTTLPLGAFDLKRQLVLATHGFVITPLDIGIRVGGAVELAGLERAPDFRRSRIMLDKAARLLPGLKTEGGAQWMGFRPSLPDSLPVIGRASNATGVLYAFGHGHLGLTQAAATARLIADLATGHTPAIDLNPYRPQRF